jgi:protein SCO1/2
MTTNLSDVQKRLPIIQKWNCCLLLFFQRLIVFRFEGLRQKKSGKWCQMEFSHWRQKRYTRWRKSYLAVKLGKPSELYDMVHTENFVLDTKKKSSWLLWRNKQDIKRLIEDITFLSTKLEMTFNGLQFNWKSQLTKQLTILKIHPKESKLSIIFF